MCRTALLFNSPWETLWQWAIAALLLRSKAQCLLQRLHVPAHMAQKE